MKGHLDVKRLESYKKDDLKKLAEELGVSAEGTIKEIAARCAAVEVDIPDESELTEEEKAAAEQAAAEYAAEQTGKVDVVATKTYLDKQLNQIKNKGDVLTVDKARAEQLVSAGVAEYKK